MMAKPTLPVLAMSPAAGRVLASFGSLFWAITEEGLNRFVAQLEQASFGEHLAEIQVAKPTKPTKPTLTVTGDEAVIGIRGLLLTSVPWYFSYFGIEATAYGDIQAQLTEANGDSRIKSIRLEVDSPGGVVTGVAETAEAIAGSGKPTRAVVGGMAASAAYYLASQADEIVATDPNGSIGSIGVFTVYYDVSERFEKEGFKAVVIRSGAHKAMGVAGAPITDEQIAAVQEEIDQIHTHFVQAVAAGRDLEEGYVRELATGRTWLAPQAREKKLIDAVRVATPTPTPESKAAAAANHERSPAMDQDKQEKSIDVESVTAEATSAGAEAERGKLAEFQAAFPEDLEFAVTAYQSGVTLEQAKSQHELMAQRLQAAEGQTSSGADASIGGTEAEGNAAADTGPDFMTVSRQRAQERSIGITPAMLQISKEQPDLHRRFKAAAEQRARPVQGELERITG